MVNNMTVVICFLKKAGKVWEKLQKIKKLKKFQFRNGLITQEHLGLEIGVRIVY